MLVTKLLIGCLAGWALVEAGRLVADKRTKVAIGYGILSLVLAVLSLSI